MNLSYPGGAALVTGGSGGIGSAVVRLLAAAGIPVAFTYNARKDAAEKIAASLNGARAVPLAWSTADSSSAAELIARAEKEVGPVRMVVTSTGIAQHTAFHRLQEDEWLRMVATNLTANIALVRSVVATMMKAGSGRIVLVTSVSGIRGLPGHTVYAATKAGLQGLARSLARECAGFGVTVNCVAPGFIDTPMLDPVPEDRRKVIAREIPMGRLGRPEEVAHVIGFLLSDQAAYVTGQTWSIDGGLST